jgi:hypothetical protein
MPVSGLPPEPGVGSAAAAGTRRKAINTENTESLKSTETTERAENEQIGNRN